MNTKEISANDQSEPSVFWSDDDDADDDADADPDADADDDKFY